MDYILVYFYVLLRRRHVLLPFGWSVPGAWSACLLALLTAMSPPIYWFFDR